MAMDVANGTRQLDSQFEDGHSAIESWLTEMHGEAGGKIHTGRSRNDQVAVALRLYMKDRLNQLQNICAEIASAGPEFRLSRRYDPQQDRRAHCLAGLKGLVTIHPSAAAQDLWGFRF